MPHRVKVLDVSVIGPLVADVHGGEDGTPVGVGAAHLEQVPV